MESDYEELFKWIEEHTITRPKRNINRDFSDALPLCEILKHHFPKLVEMHNYTPKNSHAQKLVNWETLNNKVLKKLKIHLSKKRIDALAKGEPGVIEKLLSEIKKIIETKSVSDDGCEVIYLEGHRSSTPVNKLQNGTKKMVPMSVFEKVKAELGEKTEAVTILKSKVDHLENLLNIKEERIKDLTVQIQAIMIQPTKNEGSKFFGFFQSTNNVNESIKSE